MTIEIQKYREINKGVVKSAFSVKIVTWGLTINDCCLMEKGDKSWVSFPSRKYEADGETKYFPYVYFDKEINIKISNLIKEKVREEAQKAKAEAVEQTSSVDLTELPF